MQHLPEYNNDCINLIPYGLPQFLDFEIPEKQVEKMAKTFVEKVAASTPSDSKPQTMINTLQLHELQKDDEGNLLRPDGHGLYRSNDYYEVKVIRHMGPWLGKWLPIPFLRHSGGSDGSGLRFRSGPTNWARSYVTRVPSPEDASVYNFRVVLAFDMQVEEPQKGKYAALSPDDVTARATCSLAEKERDNSWFVLQGWVDGWLKELWTTYFQDKSHRRERPRNNEDKENQLDYLAVYYVYLEFLQEAIGHRSVQIVNLSGTQERPSEVSETIDVDLVLDIGNSRSTGILIENQISKNTDLNDSYHLQLRDMSRPELFYSEPFETRVEFSRTDFGSAMFSKRSGRRSNAFAWPSPVRTGPEANRLGSLAANTRGTSGMTSPKRYLWDLGESSDMWYFNKFANSSGDEQLVSTNPICRYVNNNGTPLSCIRELNGEAGGKDEPKSYLSNLFNAILPSCREQEMMPASQPRFSHSSMMMFLFMELIQQAMITINSPGHRSRRNFPDRPRRLRSIIFTMPPGMPYAEQRIYRFWAYAAVSVLWESLGWKKHFYVDPPSTRSGVRGQNRGHDYRMNPEIRCRWDEATCTQLVYLYNEITYNFAGDAHLFFESQGREREVPREDYPNLTEEKPTLRIATIDVGGGTTDLSLTTYILANDRSSTDRIFPKQEFRDGFNVGGDDVLRGIVSNIVCKAIADELLRRGVGQRRTEIIRDMFKKKSDDIRVQKKRVQFLRQVAIPMAYNLLEQYEKKALYDQTSNLVISLPELFRERDDEPEGPVALQPLDDVWNFFNSEVRNGCNIDMDIRNFEFSVPCGEVDAVINGIISPVLNNMAELINLYNCDLLLLTGRPSCWNAVTRQILTMLPVAPDRVIPMHKYLVGNWYPFASARGHIHDPKTTVVTGAILCALAENNIEGFVFDSSRLELKNTANYIGELEQQGTLPDDKVWFAVEDAEKKQGTELPPRVVEFSSAISIGFRQLAVPRWTATRCWRMEFVDEESRRASQGMTPYRVTVRYEISEAEDEVDTVPEAGKDLKAKLNEPQIDWSEGIVDRWGALVPGRPLRIVLRTLGKSDEDGCWMDTGILPS